VHICLPPAVIGGNTEPPQLWPENWTSALEAASDWLWEPVRYACALAKRVASIGEQAKYGFRDIFEARRALPAGLRLLLAIHHLRECHC
jgi:hypothetical protein